MQNQPVFYDEDIRHNPLFAEHILCAVRIYHVLQNNRPVLAKTENIARSRHHYLHFETFSTQNTTIIFNKHTYKYTNFHHQRIQNNTTHILVNF